MVCTEWSTAFQRWTDLACGMDTRNLIAKAEIVRLDTPGRTVVVHQNMLSPIAPLSQSIYTCAVSPTYSPPAFISTWQTWKVGIRNQLWSSFGRTLHGHGVSEALLQRFARAAFCSHSFDSQSRLGIGEAGLYFGCRDANRRGMNSIMYKVVKQRSWKRLQSPVSSRVQLCAVPSSTRRR